MKVEVECYSGYKADERPVRFVLNGREYVVDEVCEQWYGPGEISFRVRTGDGNIYILRRRLAAPEGEWTLR